VRLKLALELVPVGTTIPHRVSSLPYALFDPTHIIVFDTTSIDFRNLRYHFLFPEQYDKPGGCTDSVLPRLILGFVDPLATVGNGCGEWVYTNFLRVVMTVSPLPALEFHRFRELGLSDAVSVYDKILRAEARVVQEEANEMSYPSGSLGIFSSNSVLDVISFEVD